MGGYLAINIIDYAGTNYSTVHDLADYNLVPYGIDVSPSATVGDFNLDDPGIIFITGCDDESGYIAQANLFGGLFEVVYQSTSKALYGIVIDTEVNAMYWIEDRGVANGMYSATLAGDDQSFVNYQENSLVSCYLVSRHQHPGRLRAVSSRRCRVRQSSCHRILLWVRRHNPFGDRGQHRLRSPSGLGRPCHAVR